jgi:S1-C subfamily serine protease
MNTAELSRFSDTLVALAEAAGRSVVRVDGGRRAPASGVVWADDGAIVTVDHALDRDEGLEVGLPDGVTVPATLVGRDPSTGIALLRADLRGLAPATFADPATLRVGALLLTLTRPGRTLRAGLGIVARVSGEWRPPAGGRIDRYVEADCTLHPGFSGGLLVDASGRAAGMATAGLVRGTPIAIPGPTLARVVTQLLEHGQVRRGFLGVATLPVRLPASLCGEGRRAGLLVTAVEDESPAARAGVSLGDVLLALDGNGLEHPGELLALLDEERIGRACQLRVGRGGEERQLSVTVGARGEKEDAR